MYKPPIVAPGIQKLLNIQNNNLETWKFEQEVCRRALVEMIILDELPFSFVEKEGFKKFMSKVQPLFHIPSRKTITRDCYDVYGELRINLKQPFRDTTKNLSHNRHMDFSAKNQLYVFDCSLY